VDRVSTGETRAAVLRKPAAQARTSKMLSPLLHLSSCRVRTFSVFKIKTGFFGTFRKLPSCQEMPKKGGNNRKGKKKQAGLSDDFWKHMPAPGSFNWRSRTWLSSDSNRIGNGPGADPDDVPRRLTYKPMLINTLPPTLPLKTSKVYGADGPWLWPIAGSTKIRDSFPSMSAIRDSTQQTAVSSLSPHRRSLSGAETPPFYAALGISSSPDTYGAPWWMKNESKKAEKATDNLPEDEQLQQQSRPMATGGLENQRFREAILSHSSPGHHTQRRIGPPMIHQQRLLSRPSTAATIPVSRALQSQFLQTSASGT
jgi:hypothetical protein